MRGSTLKELYKPLYNFRAESRDFKYAVHPSCDQPYFQSRIVHCPYRLAAQLGCSEITNMLLSSHKYLLQEDLDPVLQDAVCSGRSDLVKSLLARGADANAESEDFGSSLQIAAKRGETELVELLLAYGADVNLRARQNQLA